MPCPEPGGGLEEGGIFRRSWWSGDGVAARGARGQQPERMRRIGVLLPSAADDVPVSSAGKNALYPGSAPVATRRDGSALHADHDPIYSAGSSPAAHMAAIAWAAALPLPQ
jgi:hypothetical protein